MISNRVDTSLRLLLRKSTPSSSTLPRMYSRSFRLKTVSLPATFCRRASALIDDCL
jgi:hypothetical protein